MSDLSTKTNILESWRKHFYFLSSDFTIGARIDRKVVTFIHNTLIQFWGDSFFELKILEELSNNTLHFIIALLTKSEDGVFYSLYETCLLIDYAKLHKKAIYKRLESVKYKSNACKDILFEIYIDYVLSMNQIPYDTEIERNGQVLEGYCYINQYKTLVECKKRYSVRSQELLIRNFLASEVISVISKSKWGFECVGIIKFKEDDVSRQDLKRVLKKFKNYLVNRHEYSFNYEHTASKINFIVKPFSEADRIELENNLVDFSIYFTVSSLNRFNSQGLNEFRVKVNYNVKYGSELASKKLIDSIKAARRQHRDDFDKVRILFFDNQYLNDLVSPLIRNEKYYEDEIKKIF